MSLSGDQGLSSKDRIVLSRMPTGLRSRETPSPRHPPVPLSLPNSSPAQLLLLKPRSRTVNTNASPVTPITLDSESRKRSWVNSASKHLGLSKLRPKASFSRGRVANMNPTAASGTSSTTRLNVQPHNLSGSSRSPVPAPLSRPRLQRPPDKPLPSLPVATVNTKSPVRRSLIDCTERPLRRSLTPPDGGVPQQEDWPTIEPTKPDIAIPSRATQSRVKPSLSGSLYEGMRALDLGDDKENVVRTEPNAKSEKNATASEGAGLVSDGNHVQETNLAVAAGGATSRPLSSSQLPKPRDSLLQSLSRHVGSPVTRQTKTSALRLHQAKAIGGFGGRKTESRDHIPPIRERAESPSVSRSKQSFPGVPVRTHSRNRYGVTGRGSPYTIPSRSKSGRKTASGDETGIDQRAFRGPADDQGFDDGQDGTTAPKPTSLRQEGRKSSLPLPTRLTCQSIEESSQGNVRENSPAEPFMSIAVNKTSVTHELPGHPVGNFAGNGAADKGDPSELTAKDKAKLLNVKELLSTTAPREDESFVDSDGESGVSIHGYDSFGGYRVRRVRNGSKMGPTLRITDSASRVLLGRVDDNTLGMQSPTPALRHKGSAPDIGSPRLANDQVRRSSAIFGRSMPLVRNLTDRSLNQHEDADQDETHNPIGEESSVNPVARAELPGDGIDFETGLLRDLHTSVNTTRATIKGTSDCQTTPTSAQRDWPCKDFAEFKTCSDLTTVTVRQNENTPENVANGSVTKRPTPTSSSRPPTIVLRTAPSKETAPFLFQDLEREQAKQEKLVNDLAKVTYDEATPVPQSKTTTPFPPRTSSRKPKPPPIIVSPPERHLPSVSFLAQRAPKAYAVSQDNIKKPRNVKTFSQSISPRTDSVKGRKISHVLAHSPSSSSKKKVISNIRGLFHKKSVESIKAETAFTESGDVADEVYPKPGRAAVDPGFVRCKPAPTATLGSQKEKRLNHPTHMNSSADEGTGQGNTKPNRNGLVEPDYPFFVQESQLKEPREQLNGMGTRALRRQNPFTSPTTPFTANLQTSTYPTSPLANSAMATNATANKIASPTTHAHPQARSPTTLAPTTPPILAATTALTHTLLDLARNSTESVRKARLIELSKCMVEVVNTARDAEKAMEKARMEASRAECAWLKCLKEVAQAEGIVKGIVESLTSEMSNA
ncbi:uncharacterized protein Z519_10376 [Cladophialophora bantiana CBS 173.52]|uniref:Uncharacterized protein n=1 Tax=Cladophialophora bantiana (strain ATCC 10958 / CBS 173.52 / CDC B-1940 / NIH 8579) TaxID=1442370 RepID=A0A0D2FQP8_CLAB1|nr:uncharacterized protein Z519_10376 [Cladophialophora bantiana CBS 173.52]KIW88892.1 hypothetical protein Z519_10376 [Cladophialophora bantiana CBS 173.52]